MLMMAPASDVKAAWSILPKVTTVVYRTFAASHFEDAAVANFSLASTSFSATSMAAFAAILTHLAIANFAFAPTSAFAAFSNIAFITASTSVVSTSVGT